MSPDPAVTNEAGAKHLHHFACMRRLEEWVTKRAGSLLDEIVYEAPLEFLADAWQKRGLTVQDALIAYVCRINYDHCYFPQEFVSELVCREVSWKLASAMRVEKPAKPNYADAVLFSSFERPGAWDFFLRRTKRDKYNEPMWFRLGKDFDTILQRQAKRFLKQLDAHVDVWMPDDVGAWLENAYISEIPEVMIGGTGMKLASEVGLFLIEAQGKIRLEGGSPTTPGSAFMASRGEPRACYNAVIVSDGNYRLSLTKTPLPDTGKWWYGLPLHWQVHHVTDEAIFLRLAAKPPDLFHGADNV